MALPHSPCRRWRGALRFPNGGFGDFPPPRPIGSCLARPKSCSRFAPSGAGRGLWCVRLAVDVCFALSTDSPREVGATRSAKPPKTERGAFPTKRACRESAALGFPPLAGVAPYPLSLPAKRARRGASPAKVVVVSVSLGQHRARSTARAAFGYSLAEGTLQGRCWDTSRRARESISRPEQARVGHHQGHFRDGASGAVGVVGAAEIVHYVWLDRATVRHSALFLAELGAANQDTSRRILMDESGDRGKTRTQASRQNREPSDTAAGAPFGRPRCGRLPSLRSA